MNYQIINCHVSGAKTSGKTTLIDCLKDYDNT